jgi:hypothetical protein
MKNFGLLTVIAVLISFSILSGSNSAPMIGPLLPTDGAESGSSMINSPPPIDSICLVFAGVDYGGDFSSPQNYANAKHITNVKVGTYYFPAITWETGASWNDQSLFSFWDDVFKFWSYPDSFTSNYGTDTGRSHVSADSKGNLHFVWHESGHPDGYEVSYTRAILDTSTGVIAYSVERPSVMISGTDGTESRFPSMAIYDDTLIVVVFVLGRPINGIGYNYSTDGGNTWAGINTAYAHGSEMVGSWMLLNVAPDTNTGNMWATVAFDITGDATMDITAFKWTAATNTWAAPETVAVAPQAAKFPYALPAIAVDSYGAPHIIFQQNLSSTSGGGDGLTGWAGCGPAGSLFYTNKVGASWSAPKKLTYPGLYEIRSYQQGHPSIGISADNVIHYSTTFPDSSSPDTSSAYMPFNAHYAAVNVDTSWYGGKVSDIPWQSSISAIYPQMTYNLYHSWFVNLGEQGPGITWSQLNSAVPPADIYYVHKDTIVEVVGIEEKEQAPQASKTILYQNYPNPSKGKTMIRFSVPSNTDISLSIYDISGRIIKTLAKGIPGAGSYFVVWDGKNSSGINVPAGVYLYQLKAGSYRETHKLLLVH